MGYREKQQNLMKLVVLSHFLLLFHVRLASQPRLGVQSWTVVVQDVFEVLRIQETAQRYI